MTIPHAHQQLELPFHAMQHAHVCMTDLILNLS